MKKFFIIIFATLTTTIHAFPQHQQISSKNAESAASNWVRINYPGYQSKMNVISLANQRGQTLLYEIQFDSINILLSGSRACVPILGCYRGTKSIVNNFNDLPCNLKEFINAFVKNIDSCFSNDTITLFHSQDWDNLIEGVSVGARFSEVVPPLIKTKWNQNYSNTGGDQYAYNYFIEPKTGCLHCIAGCGAVALAQVMNYWHYPVLYNDSLQIDWCNMSNTLDYGTSDYETHRNAVARLIYKCANDIHSTFGCESTSSRLENTRKALVEKYGYDSIAMWIKKDDYSGNWNSLIKFNLDIGYPIIYRGSGSGGHAFVCDGYCDDGRFHFNWGWNGNFDGYYYLYNLTPGTHNYNNNHSAIFFIRPSTSVSYCNVTLNLETFFYSNIPLLIDFFPYEITPQTMTTLTSASVSTPSAWRTIPNGATALYQAHKEINLQDGFDAELGCEFEARIEPCEQCDELGENILSENEEFENPENGDDNEMYYSAGKPTQSIATDLFPNPTDGPLTMPVDSEAQEVFVFTLDGRPVGGWRLTAHTKTAVTLDVSHLAPAAYLLSVRTSSGLHTARFIRQ